MTVLEAITEAHLLAKGKATAPGNTTSSYLALKSLVNVVQRMWQDEPDVQWDSLRFTASIAGVTATNTFPLPATVREISQHDKDLVSIVHLDGQITYYTVVEPEELQWYTRNGMQAVANDSGNLVFAIAFTATNAQIGGEIKIPSYGYVTSLDDEADVIQVDNVTWVTLMMAAEFCRTKTSLRSRVDELVERAGVVMDKMKQQQRGSNATVVAYPSSLGRSW